MADTNAGPLGTNTKSKATPATVSVPAGTPEAQAQAVSAPPTIKQYEVQRDFEVPRGASSYRLHQGQVISSQGYDIAGLMKIGVRLKEVA